jgi:hypothetical protein
VFLAPVPGTFCRPWCLPGTVGAPRGHLPGAALVESRTRNTIAHLLSSVPYREVPPPVLELPERPKSTGYERPPRDLQTYVPHHAASL